VRGLVRRERLFLAERQRDVVEAFEQALAGEVVQVEREAPRRARLEIDRDLLAGVGTAVALSWFWLLPVVLGGIYFIYSATVEERFLTEQFPDSYPAYKRSTKMLVPFIL